MANSQDQGTGKHPHKSSEQPWPHTESHRREDGGWNEGSHAKGEDRSFDRNREPGSHASGGRSEEQSLKEREYKGPDGEVHHHTRTYEEQHKSR